MASEQKTFCSLPDHSNENADFYCPECKRFMCNKCNSHHSEFFKNFHHEYKLEADKKNIFTGICPEVNHTIELNYFCKTHNILCCGLCISKIKDQFNGKHNNCEICTIKEIEEEKRTKFKENIEFFGNLSKNLGASIKGLKDINKKNLENKENISKNIQEIFTKIKKELNARKNELLIQVDKAYEGSFIDEKIIADYEKLPTKIKLELNQAKLAEDQWKENKLNFSINCCLILENNIQELNSIQNKIKEYDQNKITIKFNPEINEISPLLDIIKNFGNINNGLNSDIKSNEIKSSFFLAFNSFFIFVNIS